MSASYAHILLTREINTPASLSSLHMTIQEAIAFNSPFVELGAISPDLPALSRENKVQECWTNFMHAAYTKKLVESGVNHIIQSLNIGEDKSTLYKKIAWFFGYVSHIVTDTTIHPIVNSINNADYQKDPEKHVECEMHQDSHIFYNITKLPPEKRASFFSNGVGECINKRSLFYSRRLDRDIAIIWDKMLNETFPDHYKTAPPEFDNWYKRFTISLSKVAEFASQFACCRNNVEIAKGKTFPTLEEISNNYISNIVTPTSKVMNYFELFDIAKINTLEIWKNISDAIFIDNSLIGSIIGNWDLMSGNLPDGKSVFWET